MLTPDADERKRRARAVWGYSGMDQKPFAAKAGLEYHQVRAMLSRTGRRAPSIDELLAMTAAAGVPREFALDGWPAFDRAAVLEARIARLEEELPTRTAGGSPPAPAGELGRRLRERETTEPDRREQGSDQDKGAQRGTER